jgi:hypothetical protein
MIDSTVLQQVLARASKDVAFRQELLSHPKATLAKEGHVQFPESVTIRMLEDTPTLHTIVLPAEVAAVQELSDAELEAVAGASATTSRAPCPSEVHTCTCVPYV